MTSSTFVNGAFEFLAVEVALGAVPVGADGDVGTGDEALADGVRTAGAPADPFEQPAVSRALMARQMTART